jgi:hypothetical protein
MSPQRENRIAGSAQTVVGETLDTLESELDTATENTVHELRSQTQKIADPALNRLTQCVDEKIPKLEAYMASHPWVVLGGLLLVGYWFSFKGGDPPADHQRTHSSRDRKGLRQISDE